jgi:hypothetical protein
MKREDWKDEVLAPDHIVSKGEKSEDAKRVQEWICLHKYHTPGLHINISRDGDFGPATEAAVKKFQSWYGIHPTGKVDSQTWMKLVSPMYKGFELVEFPSGTTLQDAIVFYANQLLAQHPTELRGNRGPWVRSFMKGYDSDDPIAGGEWAAWCNGFVSTVVDMACHSLGLNMDEIFPWSWSCPQSRNFAMSGKYCSKYITSEEVSANPDIAVPGDIGFTMRGSSPKHVFLIIEKDNTVAFTTEGNTNDDGSADGYEVCSNPRNLASGKYSIIKLQE